MPPVNPSQKPTWRALAAFPLHPFLLAVYSPLALYASNASEVAAGVILRPLLAALALSALLLVVGKAIFRHWRNAALAASLALLLFFAYGHTYNLLKSLPELAAVARHRVLAPLYLLVLLVGLAFVFWRMRRTRNITMVLNLAGVFLVAFPLGQGMIRSVENHWRAGQTEVVLGRSTTEVHVLEGQPPPSVYFIVLDTYMRSDALQRDLGFDNSAFVRELERLGFYVPPCTRVNYDFTMGSLTSTLNMDYLDSLYSQLAAQGLDPDVFSLLKQSRVRSELEGLGYQTVAFDSGYEWSRLYDASAYLAIGKDSLALQSMNPFEVMLIKSTALRLLTDYSIFTVRTDFNLPSSQFNDHINLEQFILATLPDLARRPEPTFVFAHILIPHWPYVFLPDGSVRTDPAYSSEDLTDDQRRVGYLDSIQFINDQMIQILERILAESRTPPVIVVMGDHGLGQENRIQNFAAIYLPGEGKSALYPTITPVNYFRVVFNSVFAADLPILPDISLRDVAPEGSPSDYRPFPETAPECLP